jgi:hypothetical protein
VKSDAPEQTQRERQDMSPVYIVVILSLLFSLSLLVIFLRKRKTHLPKGSATYSGTIRVTDRHGRDMKIVQMEDGTFEMTEEKKS